MSLFEVTKTRFREGLWEGLVTAQDAAAPAPQIAVTLHDQPLAGVTVTEIAYTEAPGRRWHLQVPVPVRAVGDGVQTFLILDAEADAVLGSFALISDDLPDDDLRAEVELLRAELDMLKRAFRRHCLETA
jgi:hypothetical protein